MTQATSTVDLRYPIGKFEPPASYTPQLRLRCVEEISRAPARLREAVRGLSEARLDTPYRPGGWTVRQLLHHVPDSHLNGYIRLKLALTEDTPTIKTYQENLWAELPDSRTVPVATSLALLDAVHVRWDALWRSLTPEQWSRSFHHPEWGTVTLDFHCALYAWHGRHHVAHITALREREGW